MFRVVFIVFLVFSYTQALDSSLHDHNHNEDIHDEDFSDDDIYGDTDTEKRDNFDYAGFVKDIVRGLTDKGFDDSDKNGDGFIDAFEIEDFMREKAGSFLKVSPELMISRYDLNSDNLLNKDEVWGIIENKDPNYFEILPEMERSNYELMNNAPDESQTENSEDEHDKRD